jgi:molybdopterin synthase sulfur carrier subunit
MRVKVRLFAAARQWAESDMLAVTCPAEATLRDLRQAIEREYPRSATLLPHVRFAVNARYVSDDYRLKPNDDVACIPPVSGG